MDQQKLVDAFGGPGVNGAELSFRGKMLEDLVARTDLFKGMSFFLSAHTHL